MPPFDGAVVFGQIRTLLANGGNANAKGRALENAMKQLLLAVPGVWKVEQNVVDALEEGEVDLGVGNMKDPQGLTFLPDAFMLECKNWNQAVGSAQVIVFVEKLRQRACDFGIVVAANGITGDVPDRRHANSTVATALRERIRIVVLTLDDLESITSTEEFIQLLRSKLLHLAMYRGVFTP